MFGIPPLLWFMMRRSSYGRRSRAPRPIIVRQSDGRAFEATCADTLRASGWRVREIGGKGDQGADLLATRMGTTVAVQCKDYAFPVPNQAVQEVYAAIAHHQAKRGVVVTMNGYTASAIELARSTKVLTLDLDGLTRLHVILGLVETRAKRPEPVLQRHEFRPGGAVQPAVVAPRSMFRRLFRA